MINLLLNKVIQMKDRLITGHLKIRFQCGLEVGLKRPQGPPNAIIITYSIIYPCY